jgi:ABC-type glycerol-3-phosphate transport system substrate-binding protein
MKKIASLFLVLVMVLGLAACATAQPENNEAPANNSQGESRFIHDITPTNNSGGVERWEYMQLESNTNAFITRVDIEELNELGTEGWEVVLRHNQYYLLKRRLP